ncbi:unnamed protein product [Cyprideis torosa]|uniref:Uncharacterized protein n=1 Tax=Cyprideis torosa TaxID=163714 RepID=A0A7R8WA54_9CRUS|nr:unnamed protein product [Cyprideis torosa]CAG0885517.1 unnamed protein product [Cyprideis torosa]
MDQSIPRRTVHVRTGGYSIGASSIHSVVPRHSRKHRNPFTITRPSDTTQISLNSEFEMANFNNHLCEGDALLFSSFSVHGHPRSAFLPFGLMNDLASDAPEFMKRVGSNERHMAATRLVAEKVFHSASTDYGVSNELDPNAPEFESPQQAPGYCYDPAVTMVAARTSPVSGLIRAVSDSDLFDSSFLPTSIKDSSYQEPLNLPDTCLHLLRPGAPGTTCSCNRQRRPFPRSRTVMKPCVPLSATSYGNPHPPPLPRAWKAERHDSEVIYSAEPLDPITIFFPNHGEPVYFDGGFGGPLTLQKRVDEPLDEIVIQSMIRKKLSVTVESEESGECAKLGNLPIPSEIEERYDPVVLSVELWKIYEAKRESPEMMLLKQKVHEDLQRRLRSVAMKSGTSSNAALRGVYVVGSTQTGMSLCGSDMDVCFYVHDDSSANNRCLALSGLMEVLRVVEKCPDIAESHVIPAKIPILRFTYKHTGLQVDMNYNSTVGIRNSHLLFCYSQLDWRVAPLTVLVKLWAKSRGINSAQQQTLSSYALSLMVIHYLQAGVHPRILPSLQLLQPEAFSSVLSSIYASTLPNALARPVIFGPNRNSLTLGDLFVGFLEYYAEYFNFRKDVISIRLGRTISREEVQSLNKCTGEGDWGFIGIEEPFELKNAAYSVHDEAAFRLILEEIKVSHHHFSRGMCAALLMAKTWGSRSARTPRTENEE